MDTNLPPLPPDQLRLLAMLMTGGFCEEVLDDLLIEHDCDVFGEGSLETKFFALTDCLGVEAVVSLAEEMDFHPSLGPYIVRRVRGDGYWCHDFGWVQDRLSANGFKASEVVARNVLLVKESGKWFWRAGSGKNDPLIRAVELHGPHSCKEAAAEDAIRVHGTRADTPVRGGLFIRYSEAADFVPYEIAA